MELSFTDASVPKRKNPGRTAEPNPFDEIVASIALKTNADGKPVAKSFKLPYGTWEEQVFDGKAKIVPVDETAITFRRRMRQLTEAGDHTTPPVTVNKVIDDHSKTLKQITFWTVPKVTKVRKNATTDATTSEDTE